MKVELHRIIHNCDNHIGWAKTDMLVSKYTANKKEGIASLKFEPQVANGYGDYTFGSPLNLSIFDYIRFWGLAPAPVPHPIKFYLFTDAANYAYWDVNLGTSTTSWTLFSLDLTSPDSETGTLNLASITKMRIQCVTSIILYYFDYIYLDIYITSDVIHPLSFIEHSVRDYPRGEFMAKGTWIPVKDDIIRIYDYFNFVADQIIFEVSITDYELTSIRKIWCESRAKRDLDEFRPSGVYNGKPDSDHIKDLIAECSYITEGTIDATTGNTDNTFKGDKTFRTILNDWADKHYKHWYLSPTGALTFNDADIDSGVVLFYHKAKYNFKDEAVGTSGTDIGFVDTDESGANCEASIIANWQGHKKVLKLYDNSNVGSTIIYHNLNSTQEYGSFEIFFGLDDVTKVASIRLLNVATELIRFFISADKFQYADNVGDHDIGLGATDNTFYHIKIEFECTVGVYKGLAQYKWHVYINETHYGDYSFVNNEAEATRIRLLTDFGSIGYNAYFDAFDSDLATGYSAGRNLTGQLFHCWNVKPKKHVDAINWVMLKGGIVAGTQIEAESKDLPSIEQLGPKLYKDTYAFITVVAQLQIAADNLRTREQLLPLAINIWSYEVNRGLIQSGECVWFAQDKANPNISPRQVILNKIIYRFLSGHTDLQTTDGIAFVKDKDKALPQENSLLLQQ